VVEGVQNISDNSCFVEENHHLVNEAAVLTHDENIFGEVQNIVNDSRVFEENHSVVNNISVFHDTGGSENIVNNMSAPVTLNFNAYNEIRGETGAGTDVDSVMSAFCSKLAEAVTSAAEGVHL
jgi:hypothetical protein